MSLYAKLNYIRQSVVPALTQQVNESTKPEVKH